MSHHKFQYHSLSTPQMILLKKSVYKSSQIFRIIHSVYFFLKFNLGSNIGKLLSYGKCQKGKILVIIFRRVSKQLTLGSVFRHFILAQWNLPPFSSLADWPLMWNQLSYIIFIENSHVSLSWVHVSIHLGCNVSTDLSIPWHIVILDW